MTKEHKFYWWALPTLFLELFFLTIVLIYAGEIGLHNFVIVAGDSLLKLLFNISLFYMMAIFFMNSTFKSFDRFLNKPEEILK